MTEEEMINDIEAQVEVPVNEEEPKESEAE